MELIQQAIISNDFGLRKSFPWSIRRQEDARVKVDSTNITINEEKYLASILGSQIPKMEDVFIGRVENPYLWSRYVLQYEEMRADSRSQNVTEKVVIHATSVSTAYEIAENNFDWRVVRRYRYGRGVSFAKDVDYAATQATRKDAYIVGGILVASSRVGNYETYIPPGNFDTTTNHKKSVYVKYYDNDFYPYYIVY